ncbi:MAG: Sua5/YciO/YrdC/YwlC family protein [Paludibacter sp.]
MHEQIKKALDVLYNGGVILYPSDTGWGLGCDAINENAVKRILEISKYPDTTDIAVLVDSPGKLQAYVDELPDIAWDLIEMSEKPLTIIYPMARNLAPNLVAADKSIGIRVTKEEFSKVLCMRFKRPVVFIPVNGLDSNKPASFYQIQDEVKSAVDYVVSYGQDNRLQSAPASVIKLGKGGLFQLIRE